METNKSVRRMSDLLIKKGKTREWAAGQMKISTSTISRWFSRGSDPHPFVVEKLRAFNKDLEKMEDAKDE